MITQLLIKAVAFLLPLASFIWVDQLSQTPKKIFSAILIIVAGLLAFAFWRGIRRAHAAGQTASARMELLSSLVAGQVFLLLMMFACYIYPLGGYLARPLMLEHSTENAQAILVLASGATKTGEFQLSGIQRVTHGVNLLKAGRAPHLYISTGYSKEDGHLEYGWVASYTRLLGLDPASFTIFVSPEITTTFTEAAYARKELAAKNINRILLVTSGAHIYRSRLTFIKSGFEVLPAPSHNQINVFYSSENHLTLLRGALHEWLGLIYYRLRQRI
jgi:uncharacterized SAM-binding protein YcdF (DUF218 family)